MTHLTKSWEIQTRQLVASEIPILSTSSSPFLLSQVQLVSAVDLERRTDYALGGFLAVILGITGKMMFPKSES